MTKSKIKKHLLGYVGSSCSEPFGPDALVFKVMGKMFALLSQKENEDKLTLKCEPSDAAVLVSQFDAIIPGYHMNKKHWITISYTGDLPQGLLSDLSTRSYELVVNKLTKPQKMRLKLGGNR